MLDVDLMEARYSTANVSGLIPVPWKRLNQASNNTDAFRQRLLDTQSGKDNAEVL